MSTSSLALVAVATGLAAQLGSGALARSDAAARLSKLAQRQPHAVLLMVQIGN
jgi:hypothetical protein